MLIEYKILYEDNPHTLSKFVTMYLAKGWAVCGTPFIYNGSIAQAMTLDSFSSETEDESLSN